MKPIHSILLPLFAVFLVSVVSGNPVLEFQRASDSPVAWEPVEVSASVLTPGGRILPGEPVGDSGFFRFDVLEVANPGVGYEAATAVGPWLERSEALVELQRSTDDGGTWSSVPVDVSMLSPGGQVLPGGAVTDLFRLSLAMTSLEEFALIPAGGFNMGDAHGEGDSDELPVHSVTVSAFFMQRTEVTNDELVRVLNWAYGQGKLTVTGTSVSNAQGDSQELVNLDSSFCQITWDGSQFVVRSGPGDAGSGYPCVEVTWYGAVAHANYRSEMEGLVPCYDLADWTCDFSAGGYRLPTEAEWEYAARGGLSGLRFPWGDTISHNEANYLANGSAYTYDVSPYGTDTYHPDWEDGTFPFTSPVGTFAPNDYGLYDLAGNVWEWCWDWYSDTYYAVSPGTDPAGPATGTVRVDRGGSWDWQADVCRVSYRDAFFEPQDSDADLGFRLVRRSDP